MNPVGQGQPIGVDRDPGRRPGTPRFRTPAPWPNARSPVPRQEGRPSAARRGVPVTPVFGTSLPLHGLAGAVRKLAYRYPDHRPIHWLLLLGGDRVEVLQHRWPRLALVALPLAIGLTVRRTRGRWW